MIVQVRVVFWLFLVTDVSTTWAVVIYQSQVKSRDQMIRDHVLCTGFWQSKEKITTWNFPRDFTILFIGGAYICGAGVVDECADIFFTAWLTYLSVQVYKLACQFEWTQTCSAFPL